MKYESYKWAPHMSGERPYEFGHLDPFSLVHEVGARQHGGRREPDPPLKIGVNVAFSHHCFTNGASSPAFDPFDLYNYHDDPRSFCAERHLLSHRLPEVVRTLPMRRCFRTRHGNYFVVVGLIDGRGLYTAYFRVSRSLHAGNVVNMLIESAYIKQKRSTPAGAAATEAFTSILLRHI